MTTTTPAWEDSLELSSALWWSHSFLERFKANRGYNPTKYLPFLFHKSNTLKAQYPPYNTTYVLGIEDEAGGQGKYLQDYRTTLNEGYREYLAAIERWSNSLNIDFFRSGCL